MNTQAHVMQQQCFDILGARGMGTLKDSKEWLRGGAPGLLASLSAQFGNGMWSELRNWVMISRTRGSVVDEGPLQDQITLGRRAQTFHEGLRGSSVGPKAPDMLGSFWNILPKSRLSIVLKHPLLCR